MSEDLEKLLRPCAVARWLDISRPYVYKLETLGLLKSISWAVPGKNGDRRVIRFHPDDVKAFIEKHRATS
jgi:hypothetical protein